MKTRTILLTAACVTATCIPFVVSSKDNPAQAKARAAMRQGMAMMNASAAGKPNAPNPGHVAVGPREDTEAQAQARQAVRQEIILLAATAEGYSGDQATGRPAPGPRQDTEAQAKARQAVRTEGPAAVVATVEQPPKQAQTPPAITKPAARKRSSNPLTEGMMAPESPFTPEQQAALAELLVPYRADQISGDEYHRKRAAIIAGT